MRDTLIRGLHLGVLWSFAVAQPLFGVVEDAPEFFAVRGSPPVDIIAFALLAVLLVPLLLTAIEALVGLASRRAAYGLQLALVFVLVWLFLFQVVGDVVNVRERVALAIGALASAGLTVAYARAGALRSMLTALAPAPLVFAALFLFASPVGDLVRPKTTAAYAGAAGAARAPVVVVVLDEFPVISMVDGRERIDAGRYPNIAALARDATWFRRATTASGFTTQSVPSIITGNLHRDDVVGFLAQDRARNLFTLLRRSHRMNVVETETTLCQRAVCAADTQPVTRRLRSLTSDLGIVAAHVVLPLALSRHVPSIADGWQNFSGAGGNEEADIEGRAAGELPPGPLTGRFITDVGRSAGAPTLSFLHVGLPHRPFTYLPSGTHYDGVPLPGLEDDRWTTDPWPVQQGYARELLQIGYVDRLIGRLVRTMRRAGIYDRAAIVVTSDHGAAFTPGCARRAVTACSLDQIAGVPMIVKAPAQARGRISDKPVRTVDVVPTVAAMLGVRVPWRTDGRDMLDPAYRGVRVVDVDRDPPARKPLAAYLRGRERALRHKVRLFGEGGGTAAFFAIGPRRGLLGRPAAAAGAAAARVELADASAYAHVRRGREPALVRGRVIGVPGSGRLGLAVVVNGRIAAVTRTYGNERRFTALVPDGAWRPGGNAVGVRVTGAA